MSTHKAVLTVQGPQCFQIVFQQQGTILTLQCNHKAFMLMQNAGYDHSEFVSAQSKIYRLAL